MALMTSGLPRILKIPTPHIRFIKFTPVMAEAVKTPENSAPPTPQVTIS